MIYLKRYLPITVVHFGSLASVELKWSALIGCNSFESEYVNNSCILLDFSRSIVREVSIYQSNNLPFSSFM